MEPTTLAELIGLGHTATGVKDESSLGVVTVSSAEPMAAATFTASTEVGQPTVSIAAGAVTLPWLFGKTDSVRSPSELRTGVAWAMSFGLKSGRRAQYPNHCSAAAD